MRNRKNKMNKIEYSSRIQMKKKKTRTRAAMAHRPGRIWGGGAGRISLGFPSTGVGWRIWVVEHRGYGRRRCAHLGASGLARDLLLRRWRLLL
jgi:hypothetical protein